MSNDIRIVIFDLGRVFVRICDGWQHACREVGIDAPTGELDTTTSAGLLDVVKRSEVGAIDVDTFCRQAAPFLRLTPQIVKAMSDAYLLGLYPGVSDILDDIHRAGLKTACLSNTNENHWRMMTDPSHRNAIPVEKLDYLFASQQLGLRKPDDAIYAEVEKQTRFSGPQIVFFDDLRENIEAARKRSWHAVQIAINPDPVGQARVRLKLLGVL